MMYQSLEDALICSFESGPKLRNQQTMVKLRTHGYDVNTSNCDGPTPLMIAAMRNASVASSILFTNGGNLEVESSCLGKQVTALIIACENGNVEVANTLLLAGADVNHHTRYSTPLIAALSSHAANGDCDDIVSLLLQHSPDIHCTCATGETALHLAARGGMVDVATNLLQAATIPTSELCAITCQSNRTAVWLAILGGHVRTCKLLLDAGANPNTFNIDQDGGCVTPLYTATVASNIALVKVLLDVPDIDVNLCNGSVANADADTAGDTPLNMAVKNGDVELVQLLLARGARCAPYIRDTTPLYHACAMGHLSIVNMLIAAGVGVNTPVSKTGKYPLAVAAEFDHADVVQALVNAGADVNQRIHMSALHVTSLNGHLKTLTKLIEYGADIELASSDNGRTPLYSAARHGHVDVVNTLLKACANVETMTTDYSRTPLLACCLGGHADVAELLVGAGANTKHTSADFGKTALHHAVNASMDSPHKARRLVTLLITSNADIDNHCGANGRTAFHLATTLNAINLARDFACFGADLHAEDKFGKKACECVGDDRGLQLWFKHVHTWNPLQIATEARHVSAIRWLLKHNEADLFQISDNTPSVLHIAQTVQSYVNAARVDNLVVKLLKTAKRGWSPRSHMLYHARARNMIKHLMLVHNRICYSYSHTVRTYYPKSSDTDNIIDHDKNDDYDNNTDDDDVDNYDNRNDNDNDYDNDIGNNDNNTHVASNTGSSRTGLPPLPLLVWHLVLSFISR